MLLDQKADPTAKDESGRNAIYLAAMSGHANVLTMLLNRIKRDHSKKGSARKIIDAMVVDEVPKQQDEEATKKQHMTPLMKAVCMGHESAVTTLLLAKANPDTVDKQTDVNPLTAFQLAAATGFARMIQLLLDHSQHLPDKSKLDQLLNAAQTTAEEHGHSEVADLLTLRRSSSKGVHASSHSQAGKPSELKRQLTAIDIDLTPEHLKRMTEELQWDKKAAFPGQLVPPRPNESERKNEMTPLGPLKRLRGLIIQKGPFDSIFIRAGCVPKSPWADLWRTLKTVVAHYKNTEIERLNEVMKAFETGAATKKPIPRAIYVAVSLHAMQAIDFGYLVEHGFRFHHYREAGHGATPKEPSLVSTASTVDGGETASPNSKRRAADKHKSSASELTGTSELVYVVEPAESLGMKGMVPSYSTSIEGATALCLSPDGAKVLLVWERGAWSTPGGAVDPGESKVETLSRELREEVGVELDEEAEIQYLGGWSAGRARDNLSNDSFSAFVVRLKSEHQKVDHQEIHEADWFEWRPLLTKWREQGEKRAKKIDIDMGKGEGRNLINGNAMLGLHLYEQGRGSKLKIKKEQQGPHQVMKATWGSLAV